MNSRPTPPAPSDRGAPSDEPEITQEEAVPSDGKDEVGEKMMKDLGRERRGADAEGADKKG